MFKRYRFEWTDRDGRTKHPVDFYVQFQKTRSGFSHRACCIGELPRTDCMGSDYAQYMRNEDRLFMSRTHKVPYMNRTWEPYPGQTCLARLWENIAKLPFVFMADVRRGNPFSVAEEPEHEDIVEADSLFAGFRRRP